MKKKEVKGGCDCSEVWRRRGRFVVDVRERAQPEAGAPGRVQREWDQQAEPGPVGRGEGQEAKRPKRVKKGKRIP